MKGILKKIKDMWVVKWDGVKDDDIHINDLYLEHNIFVHPETSTLSFIEGDEVDFYPIIDAKINMVQQFALLTPKKESLMKNNKINEGHYLELTDRVHVMACNFENHIYEHPLAKKDKEIKKITNKILHLFGELYQITGTKMHNENGKHESPIHKVVFGRYKKSKNRRLDNT